MLVTAVIEVALRNAVYENIEAFFQKPDWLINPPQSLKWEDSEKAKITKALKDSRRAIYAKMSQTQKRNLNTLAFPNGVIPLSYSGKLGHKRIVVKRQEQISPTMGQVVSQLTFFFWKRMFAKEYEHVLWHKFLKSLFPDRSLTRTDVATQLEYIYQSRNRVAHHEPVYGVRLQNTISAIDFIINNFDGKDESGTPHIGRLLSEDFAALKTASNELDTRIAAFKV